MKRRIRLPEPPPVLVWFAVFAIAVECALRLIKEGWEL